MWLVVSALLSTAIQNISIITDSLPDRAVLEDTHQEPHTKNAACPMTEANEMKSGPISRWSDKRMRLNVGMYVFQLQSDQATRR